jgi:peptide chain release factor
MNEVILHLSAGQGPHECEWVVARLVEAFVREAAAEGLTAEPIEPVAGPCPSALLRVAGTGADGFAAARCGTIRWIGTSPFRPLHKRRNWFVGVHRLAVADAITGLDDRDIRYEAMRAQGPGGQHVNKTDSAVRATHLPTGLTTVSQDQRSQFANKKIARLKLGLMIERQRDQRLASDRTDAWQRNQELERGNAVRTYEGPRFRLARPG